MVEFISGERERLIDRIELIEAAFEGPGARENEVGRCTVAFTDPSGYVSGIQKETVMKYLASADEKPGKLSLLMARQDLGSGETLVFYLAPGEPPLYAVERWLGCEFQGSSGWRHTKG